MSMKITARNVKNGCAQFNWYASLDDYRIAIEHFATENGKYPSSTDFDASTYLPTSKTIQRKFGSIKKLREAIGFSGEDVDQRTGTQRSLKALELGINAFDLENNVYKHLLEKYKESSIHRQSPYTTLSRRSCDFKIGDIFIDIFYPVDKHSLHGCINAKQKKLSTLNITQPVIFVVMNEDMTQDFIDNVVINKKNSIPHNIKVMSYATFKKVV